MQMKKTSVIFIFLSTILMLSSCSKKPLHKSKSLGPVADRPEVGSLAWIDRLQYDGENSLAYGVFNNDRDLVIRTMTRNNSTMTKMFAGGFTISIDTTGKKKPQFAVSYPMPQGMQPVRDENAELPTVRNRSDFRSPPNRNLRFKTALNRIELKGFDQETIDGAILNTRDGKGITAWISLDSTGMFYELKIPLAAIFNQQNSTGKIISVGFVSGELDLPSRGGPGEDLRPEDFGPEIGPGGRTPRSGTGRPGGNMSSGRPGGGMGPARDALSKPIDIWMKRIELR